MNVVAAKRLQKEYMKFLTDPPAGLSAAPTDEENLYKWHALLSGPNDTPFEGGTFRVEVICPTNYPNSPPQVTFLSKMFHPNVYSNGNVCVDILASKWKFSLEIADILNTLMVLLGDPNIHSPANVEAKDMFMKHPEDLSYSKRVSDIVKASEAFFPRDGASAYINFNL